MANDGDGDGDGGGQLASKLRQDDKSVIMSMFAERARGCEGDNEKVVEEGNPTEVHFSWK